MRTSLLLVVAAGIAAAGAWSASTFVIQGDRTVGGLRMSRSSPAEAIARFGAPAVKRSRPTSCVMAWPRLGLTVTFLNFEGGACTNGVPVVASVTNRTRWRTAVGLRVGDGIARLRRLYPRAARHTGSFGGTNGFWLVTRRACAEVGASAYPGLLARIRDGRVSAIVATTGLCE